MELPAFQKAWASSLTRYSQEPTLFYKRIHENSQIGSRCLNNAKRRVDLIAWLWKPDFPPKLVFFVIFEWESVVLCVYTAVILLLSGILVFFLLNQLLLKFYSKWYVLQQVASYYHGCTVSTPLPIEQIFLTSSDHLSSTNSGSYYAILRHPCHLKPYRYNKSIHRFKQNFFSFLNRFTFSKIYLYTKSRKVTGVQLWARRKSSFLYAKFEEDQYLIGNLAWGYIYIHTYKYLYKLINNSYIYIYIYV